MVNTGQMDKGLQMMQEARREKATEEHNVIDEALADQGQGYTVFSIVSAPSYTADGKTLYLHSISLSVYSTVRRRRNSRMPCRRTTWERLWVAIPVVAKLMLISSPQRLIASSDPNDNITDFTGSARLKMGITPTGIFLNDRPDGDNTTPTVVRSATVPGSMPRPSKQPAVILPLPPS